MTDCKLILNYGKDRREDGSANKIEEPQGAQKEEIQQGGTSQRSESVHLFQCNRKPMRESIETMEAGCVAKIGIAVV
jgi:hypothetical protein